MENKRMEIYITTNLNEIFLFIEPNSVNLNSFDLTIDDKSIQIKDITDISSVNGSNYLKIIIDTIIERMNEIEEIPELPKKKLNYGFSADSLGIIIESKEYESMMNLTTFLKENGYKLKNLHFSFIGNETNQYIFTFDPKAFNESQKEQMYEEDRDNFKPLKFRKMIGDE